MPIDVLINQKTENYWQHYGLMHNPFDSNAGIEHTLLFTKWEHYLDLLQHLIHSENVLLAVLGPKGSGKTTLAKQLMAQIGETMRAKYLISNVNINILNIIQIMQENFNLSSFDNELLEERLDNQIADLQYHDQTAVLIFDDAQELPEETIQTLFYLIKQQSKTQMRLHVLMFGDQQLQSKLSKLARQELSGELIHSIELEPLTLEETRHYLQHRLSAAKGKQLFTSVMIDNIYQSSRGIPERINYYAARTLMELISEQQMSTEPGLIGQHQTKIIGGTLLLVLLGFVVFLLTQGAEKNSLMVAKNSSSLAYEKPVFNHEEALQQNLLASVNHSYENNIKTIQPRIIKQAPILAQNSEIQTSKLISLQKPTIDIHNQPLLSSTTSTITKTHTEQKTKYIHAIISKPLSTPVAKGLPLKSIELQHTNEQKSASNINNEHPQSIAVLEHDMLMPEATSLSHAEQKLEKQKHLKKSVVKHHKAKSKPKIKKALTQNKKLSKHWLSLKAQPNHYTLQLVALDNVHELNNFIAHNHLQGKVQKFVVRRNGRHFYVATYGNYNSRQTAQAAVKKLPLLAQANKAWIRSFGSLEKARG